MQKNWFMPKWQEKKDGSLPIYGEFDVAVIGAGPAGIAAASTSARLGLKTLVIEKNGFCGGASVAGLSGTICGMYLTQKEIQKKEPEQLVFGFTDEFYQGLKKAGGVTEPQVYGNTHIVTFDPYIYKDVADKILTDSNVDILFHTLVTGVTEKDGEIRELTIESSAGTSRVFAGSFIDASGDGVVITKTGYGYNYGSSGVIQNPTMMFRLNKVSDKDFYNYFGYDTICPEDLTNKLREAYKSGNYCTPREKVWVFPTPQKGVFLMNCTQLAGQKGEMLNVVDPDDKTIAEINGRKSAREYHRFFKDNVKGFENSELIDMGSEVGARQTRSIVGELTLTNADVYDCRKRDDAIVKSSWPIELQSIKGNKLQWLDNDYYEVPYLTLVPKSTKNLIVAGRLLSSEHEAFASARVTAQCFEYGHAAGVATYLVQKNNQSYKDIDIKEIQKIMKENGSNL